MTVHFATRTDTGRQRSHNEDAVTAVKIDGVGLIAVADGMGGHAAGDVASQRTLSTLKERLRTTTSDWKVALASGITAANTAVRSHPDAGGDRGMGTTLVAAVINKQEAIIANVGDSRAYHIGDNIVQVTTDQSLVQQLVEAGHITEAEAETHPQRNVVSQAIGTNEDIDPDFYEHTVSGTLLLCSDGLSEEVSDEQIYRTVTNATSLSAAADNLIAQANNNGGSDNITVALATTEAKQ